MIPLCIPEISGNEWKYIKECLDTNWVSSVGSYVDLFEQKFKEYVNSKSSIVTMNGTSAITLALRTLGIGKGDEVIVPSMTFIASVNPIKYVGAEPVFVDITEDTWVMDIEKVEELINIKTKAIMPVHLYGNMVDMESLLKIAEKYKLHIIEDATEALGSEYKMSDGRWCKAGTMGIFGIFSFNGNKLITTGAGGMLITNDEVLGEKAKYFSTQAKTLLDNGGFYHEEIGYNYRMPNILSAMGVAQLERINEYIAKKIEHAQIYNKLLKDVKEIKLPCEKENIKHSQWIYSLVIQDNFSIDRNMLIKYLKENEIESRPFFYPVHMMNPYLNSKRGSLKVTCDLSNKGINLPSSVSLTEKQILKVCKCFLNY